MQEEDESEPVSVSDDSGDEQKVKFTREVRYKVKDGTPGLKIRRGNTMQSWKWTPIASSPIANRTRSRISKLTLLTCFGHIIIISYV